MVYLDNILIYTKNLNEPHIDAVQWILEKLQKYGLYANLKTCQFHEDDVQFLGYVVLAQSIKIEEERIETIKT